MIDWMLDIMPGDMWIIFFGVWIALFVGVHFSEEE